MPAGSPKPSPLLEELFEAMDPMLGPAARDEFLRRRAAGAAPAYARTGRIVLVGHRSAGKTRMLPLIGRWVGCPTVDLDAELERQSGRLLRQWVTEDESGFRAAERALFQSRPTEEVAAAGGGFLSLHADLLQGHTPVLIPITFQTYRARLMADTTRPRLRPALSLEEELRSIFDEREALHARVRTVPLVDFLLGEAQH